MSDDYPLHRRCRCVIVIAGLTDAAWVEHDQAEDTGAEPPCRAMVRAGPQPGDWFHAGGWNNMVQIDGGPVGGAWRRSRWVGICTSRYGSGGRAMYAISNMGAVGLRGERRRVEFDWFQTLRADLEQYTAMYKPWRLP